MPPGLTGVVQIAAAKNLSIARKSDGTIVVWGGGYAPGAFTGSGLAYAGATNAFDFSQLLGLNRVSLRLGTWSIHSGQTTTLSLYLPEAAGPAGATVTIEPESPVVSGPATVVVPAGKTTATFIVQAEPTTTTQTVYIKASYGGGEAYATLTVQAPYVKAISIPVKVFGIQQPTGKVYLGKPAPAGGVTVSLTGGSGLTLPATVIVPAGATVASFTFETEDVSSETSSFIQASAGGASVSKAIVVAPNILTLFKLSPTSVQGGSATVVTGTLTLTAPVAVDTKVSLSPFGPEVTVPGFVTIPAGSNTATFTVGHSAVSTTKTVKILAMRKTIKYANLKLTP